MAATIGAEPQTKLQVALALTIARKSVSCDFTSRVACVLQNKATSVVTIERFIIEQERQHPKPRAAVRHPLRHGARRKMIANKVRSAGLADILGSAGEENVQGEIQQKLDVFANETIIKAMDHSGRCAAWRRRRTRRSSPFPTDSAAASTVSCSIRLTARRIST